MQHFKSYKQKTDNMIRETKIMILLAINGKLLLSSNEYISGAIF